jgi:hypothetical protein
LLSESTKEPLIKSRFYSPQSYKRILFKGSYESLIGDSTLAVPYEHPEDLNNIECKKGTPPVRPPIPYVSLTDLLKKRETEHIKVELPDGTK